MWSRLWIYKLCDLVFFGIYEDIYFSREKEISRNSTFTGNSTFIYSNFWPNKMIPNYVISIFWIQFFSEGSPQKSIHGKQYLQTFELWTLLIFCYWTFSEKCKKKTIWQLRRWVFFGLEDTFFLIFELYFQKKPKLERIGFWPTRTFKKREKHNGNMLEHEHINYVI